MIRLTSRNQPYLILILIMGLSLGLHSLLISRLNIVEDESGYMQDAAQVSWHVLPFREFGGTKGPLFLVTLHLWQRAFGSTVESSRMFAVIAHIASIPLIYLFTRNITASRLVGYIASCLWGITPIVVGLTSNVMHIPLELLFILIGATLLTQKTTQPTRFIIGSAVMFFVAVLTRATAAAFFPLFLVLLCLHKPFWKSVSMFCLTGGILLLATIAIIYPLYGWPKTAFFFNADAVLISGKQRAVYTAQEPTIGIAESMFRAALPAWREGLFLMLTALLMPLLWLSQRVSRILALLLWGILIWSLGSLLLADIDSWWPKEHFVFQWTVARLTLALSVLGGGIGIWYARRFSRIATSVILILFMWISGFVLFYKGWGRSPTPYYVLESIPAFSIAAAITIYTLGEKIRQLRQPIHVWGSIGIGACLLMMIGAPYPAMTEQQYRGTISLAAAKELTTHIKSLVPAGEPLFTGQPVFAYLSEHPLYGGYTHPGWYLSERAGYLPAEIRRVFLPDFDTLVQNVQHEVHWIVVDWRTNDIYFNTNTNATAPLRTMLETEFTPVVTVKNPASRDITLYRRNDVNPSH